MQGAGKARCTTAGACARTLYRFTMYPPEIMPSDAHGMTVMPVKMDAMLLVTLKCFCSREQRWKRCGWGGGAGGAGKVGTTDPSWGMARDLRLAARPALPPALCRRSLEDNVTSQHTVTPSAPTQPTRTGTYLYEKWEELRAQKAWRQEGGGGRGGGGARVTCHNGGRRGHPAWGNNVTARTQRTPRAKRSG
jgi:hypothetical protein